MITNSLKGIASLVLAVALIGLVAGLVMAGSDIVNPWTSQAAATQMKVQTEHEAAKNEIDRHYYAQERQLNAFAEETRMNDRLAYLRRMDAIKLKLVDIGGKVVIGVLAYLAALSGFLIFWSRLQRMLKRQEAALKRDPQFTPAYLRPQPTVSQNRNGRVHTPIQNRTTPTHSRVNA